MNESDVSVVLDHARFLVLLKPAGASMHSENGAGWVVTASAQLGMPLLPVHRLDRVTSGVLLLAKDSAAAAELAALFAAHRIEKYYLALSDKRSHKKQGRVIGDMLPARNGSWKLAHSKVQPAQTDFMSAGLGDGLRAYLLKPATGKTHQLRVALKSQGAAILGDERYGGSVADRTYLHAWALRFSAFGENFSVQAKPASGAHFLTEQMQQQLLSWQPPWVQFAASHASVLAASSTSSVATTAPGKNL